MPLSVKVELRARDEIAGAVDWWRRHREKAPSAIDDDLEAAFELISVQPQVGQPVVVPGLEGVRRILLARVRYHLYFRLSTDRAAVHVLAFWHTSRGTDPFP